MTFEEIVRQIRSWVKPKREQFEYKTYGTTRIWGPDGNELDPSDPEYIRIKQTYDAVLRASMGVKR